MRSVLAFLLIVACSRTDTPAARIQDTASRETAALPDFPITGTAMAGFRLCQPLALVNTVFPTAKDTVMVGEDDETRWPSKVVLLAPGEELLFETSWVDTVHVSRITTTSPRGRTRSALRVGSTIADVLATGDSLTFEYPEGILAISLSRDSVGFEVDDSAAGRFWRRFNFAGDPLQALDRGAKVKVLGIGIDCRQTKAAA